MHSSRGYKPIWRGGQGYAPNLLRRAAGQYNTMYNPANNQIEARALLASKLQKAAREKIWRNRFWEEKYPPYTLQGRRRMAARAKARRWRQGRS